MLGTTMAAVNWYEVVARRKHLRPSRVTLILIATIAAAFTVAVQQGVRVLAAGLPLTHSGTALMLTTPTCGHKWSSSP